MKASNQGFVDLHTPAGFFLIGACFLGLTLIIVLGSIYFKALAAKEREERRKLRLSVANALDSDAETSGKGNFS